MTTEIADVLFAEMSNGSGKVGVITLNRPEVYNAVNLPMFLAINEQLQHWQEDFHIKAVLIQGAGDRAFCAGGDIRSLYVAKQQGLSSWTPFFNKEYHLNALIYHYRKPYIALLNGLTMGGGVGLSIHGRWRIATERFIFAMPETGIGFFPDIGAGYFLARLPSRIGYYLGLTGNRVHAADALALELIDAIIPSDQLALLRDRLLSANYVNNGDSAIANVISRYQLRPKRSDLVLLPKSTMIEKHFSGDTVEEIMANLQACRDPWCQETLQVLQQRSPTSLKVTLLHLQHCAELSFSGVIAEDSHLAKQFLQCHDLFEGIRAMIIDKDHHPHWQPPHVSAVSTHQVNAFFP